MKSPSTPARPRRPLALAGLLLLPSLTLSAAADSVVWAWNGYSALGHTNNYSDVYQSGLDGTAPAPEIVGPSGYPTPLLAELSHSLDVAVDPATHQIYRARGSTISSGNLPDAIERCDRNGAGLEIFQQTGARKLALAGGFLYWAGSNGTTIARKQLSLGAASGPDAAWSVAGTGITALAADPAGGFLYYSHESEQSGMSTAVYRVSLSTPGAPVLITDIINHQPPGENEQSVYGLAFDHSRQLLYVLAGAEGATSSIYRMNAAGSGVTRVVTDTAFSSFGSPDIAADSQSGRIYWTARTTDGRSYLRRANGDGGTAQTLTSEVAPSLHSVGYGGLDLDVTDGGPAACPPGNLLLWLPFDEPAGSGPATRNLIGEPNGTRFDGTTAGGTTTGPASTPGYVGRSFDFDGTNDSVDVPWHQRIDIGTGDFSLNAWVRLDSANGGVRVLMDHRSPGALLRGYHWFVNTDGSLGLQLADAGGFNSFTSSPVRVPVGDWHFLSVTVDRDIIDGIKFYIDGTLVAMRDPRARQGSLANSASFRVGARSTANPTGFFPGAIDELQLFGRTQTAEEVRELFVAGPSGQCRFVTRVPLWNMWCPGNLNAVGGIISNFSKDEVTFAYVFGGFFNQLNITPATPRIVTVPPGGRADVTASVTSAPGAPPSLSYQLTAWPVNDPRNIRVSTGRLTRPAWGCLLMGNVISNGLRNDVTMSLYMPKTVSVHFTNDSGSIVSSDILGRAMFTGGGENLTDFELDGLMGTPISRHLNLAPGQSTDISFTVRALREGLQADTDLVFTLAATGEVIGSLMLTPENAPAVLGDLSAAPAPGGSLLLTWPSGVLEESSDLSTWISVPGAAGNSYTAGISGASTPGRRFFRARQ